MDGTHGKDGGRQTGYTGHGLVQRGSVDEADLKRTGRKLYVKTFDAWIWRGGRRSIWQRTERDGGTALLNVQTCAGGTKHLACTSSAVCCIYLVFVSYHKLVVYRIFNLCYSLFRFYHSCRSMQPASSHVTRVHLHMKSLSNRGHQHPLCRPQLRTNCQAMLWTAIHSWIWTQTQGLIRKFLCT